MNMSCGKHVLNTAIAVPLRRTLSQLSTSQKCISLALTSSEAERKVNISEMEVRALCYTPNEGC